MVYVRRFAAACAIFFLLGAIVHAANRPLPEDVNVKVFAKTDQTRLDLLVRIPLAAVKDIQFPARGDTGYLDLSAVKSMLPGASRYWIANCFDVYENGAPAAKPEIASARISATSDTSFDSYENALAHLSASDLPPESNVFWDQVWLDVRFEYPLRSDRPSIEIRPKLSGLGVRVSTDMKYVAQDGGVRDFSFQGDPGLIYLDARWSDAAEQFLGWGFRSVLGSADFLLFLFCLALPFRRYREVLPAVTAFAGALSIAFLASAFGFALDAIWFHPLIETLTAIAVLLTAFANIAGRAMPRRRALLALASGFVFGFSCSFDYGAKVQFGGSHFVVSAIAFGAGVLLALAFVIALLVPVLSFLFSFARTERVELIVVSALAADTSWGWLEDRWALLSKVPFHALVFDAGLLVVILRCMTVLVLFGGLLWFADGWLKSHGFPADEPSPQRKGRTAA